MAHDLLETFALVVAQAVAVPHGEDGEVVGQLAGGEAVGRRRLGFGGSGLGFRAGTRAPYALAAVGVLEHRAWCRR
jgi:hypothetical protein